MAWIDRELCNLHTGKTRKKWKKALSRGIAIFEDFELDLNVPIVPVVTVVCQFVCCALVRLRAWNQSRTKALRKHEKGWKRDKERQKVARVAKVAKFLLPSHWGTMTDAIKWVWICISLPQIGTKLVLKVQPWWLRYRRMRDSRRCRCATFIHMMMLCTCIYIAEHTIRRLTVDRALFLCSNRKSSLRHAGVWPAPGLDLWSYCTGCCCFDTDYTSFLKFFPLPLLCRLTVITFAFLIKAWKKILKSRLASHLYLSWRGIVLPG